jgi:hypothetical protein
LHLQLHSAPWNNSHNGDTRVLRGYHLWLPRNHCTSSFIFHNFIVKINTFLGRVVAFFTEWWSRSRPVPTGRGRTLRTIKTEYSELCEG